MTWYEAAQGWIAAATFPVSVVFLILFCRPTEHWWATWFGRSLFLLGVGVCAYSAATVLYRWHGDYPGRPFLLLFSTSSVFVAMAIRTGVLWHSQRKGRHRYARISDALVIVDVVRDFEDAVHRIEHLEPCPNPDCMAFRAELVDMAHRLPSHNH